MKIKKMSYVKKTVAMICVLCGLIVIMSIFAMLYFMNTGYLGVSEKMLAFAGLALFYCLLYIAVIRLIIRPYYSYRRLFKRFTEGQVYQEILDKSPDYMEELGEVFARFDELVDRNKTIQLSTKQAEFLALQNQINPHFLYNTLDAIRGDALCAGMEHIANITEALSTFFRYTITETGSLVTMMDEISNVEDYFTIQQYRFGEKLRMEIDMGEDAERIMQLACPKLMLQPIVENAIFHGLEKKAEGGMVRIETVMTQKKIIINVHDNGVGIEEEDLERINKELEHVSVGYIQESKKKKGGIALNNVCRRIKLLFGEEYGIRVFSLNKLGTNVCITLPVIGRSKED